VLARPPVAALNRARDDRTTAGSEGGGWGGPRPTLGGSSHRQKPGDAPDCLGGLKGAGRSRPKAVVVSADLYLTRAELRASDMSLSDRERTGGFL